MWGSVKLLIEFKFSNKSLRPRPYHFSYDNIVES